MFQTPPQRGDLIALPNNVVARFTGVVKSCSGCGSPAFEAQYTSGDESILFFCGSVIVQDEDGYHYDASDVLTPEMLGSAALALLARLGMFRGSPVDLPQGTTIEDLEDVQRFQDLIRSRLNGGDITNYWDSQSPPRIFKVVVLPVDSATMNPNNEPRSIHDFQRWEHN